jgi:3-oxoacyl-[acyl-carrier-protein] synthase II
MAVVISCIGAVTAFGLGIEPAVAALLGGRTAIRPIRAFSTDGLCSSLGAEAPLDEALLAATAGLRRAPAPDRASRLLLAALADALGGRELQRSRRRGVLVGTTKGALEEAILNWERGTAPGEDLLGAPARALAVATHSLGPVYTVGAACASSAVALGEAQRLIEDGNCDEVLVAGTEALHPFVYQGFHALRALAPTPAAPFDVRRSGLTLGEGAAVLLVESLAHATREGREPLVVVEGFGSAVDGFDQTAPNPAGTGLLAACHAALSAAGVAPREVDRYHAHGTATVQNDKMEAVVHAALFSDVRIPVCAIKGGLGHTLGAAAVLDVAVCAMTLRQGLLPPVVNFERVDPDAPVPAVVGRARASTGRRALVANAGFGGINTAIILRTAG